MRPASLLKDEHIEFEDLRKVSLDKLIIFRTAAYNATI